MAIKFSDGVRNARLDAIESYISGQTGTKKLRIYTGTAPSSISTAATGTLLVDIALPADFMAAAASGQKALSGIWTASAASSGTFGYFRIVSDNSGTITSHVQGTVGTSGADLIMSSASCSSGQTVTITGFTITDGNA